MKCNFNEKNFNFTLILIFLFFILQINCNKLNALNNKSELTTELKSTSKMKVKLTTKYCNSLCRECAENDLNYCTICQPGIILFEYNCINKCPEGTYLDKEWRECRKCSENCPVCWGPQDNMCGTSYGVKSSVVFLEKEIKDFLKQYTFTKKEIEEWIESLKIILDKKTEEKLINDLNFDNLSSNDVYKSEHKIINLPIGSYSKFDGVFIPIPTYRNSNKVLVNSHWVFKKGMWDGKRWVNQHFPRLPSFIKEKGEQNKIYFENSGFWLWEPNKEWYWIKTEQLKEPQSSVEENLIMLNTIRLDLGDYNRKRWNENQEIKKLKIQNNLRTFFDKFLSSNRLIFSEMKHTINDSQINLIQSLDNLKNQAHDYFLEDSYDSNISARSKMNRYKNLSSIKQ